MRLAFVSGKGGTGKTTSSVFMAAALHKQGRTLAIDADPQGSLQAWSAKGELPFTVVSMPTAHIHRQIKDLAADYEHVVIDTPPGDMAITRSAILAVPLVIVPVSATGLDIDRLRPTWEALADLVAPGTKPLPQPPQRPQLPDGDLTADADLIAQGLHLDPKDVKDRIRHFAGSPQYQPIYLKDDITPDELAFIESHRNELPELDTIMAHRRLYPRNGFMAHLIGYVGEVSEEMLNQPQFELYNPGDVVGKSGVELQYNTILMGKNGSRRAVVNSHGKEVGQLGQAAPSLSATS